MKKIIFALIAALCLSSAAYSQNMRAIADCFIDRFPDPDMIHSYKSSNTVSWQPGYVMFAMEYMWRKTRDLRYYNYIKRYIDQHVDEEEGIIYQSLMLLPFQF